MTSMDQRIVLNIHYDQPPAVWDVIADVYRSMPGWLEAPDLPRWFGLDDDPIQVWASVEPSGIVFEGRMDDDAWMGWVTTLCARLSASLGRDVRDAEA